MYLCQGLNLIKNMEISKLSTFKPFNKNYNCEAED